MELSKQYEPSLVEDRIFSLWEKLGYFHVEPDETDETYCIVIPPPNVTGVLHMGHALNNTIQDILIRKARMDGKKVRWVVGTDHAGIATQNVVEKKLRKEGKTRHDLGREALLKEVWDWKDHHGSTIITQLKKMGCSCDYTLERFTMDEGLAKAVRVCFVKLFEKDLIYRGNRMIHWCPRCLTALSDEEAEHHDESGKLYHISYPYEDGSGHIEIATTRPETLLGDTAIAVHPDDERYHDRIGKLVIVPFVNRKIPIIADSFVDPEFGTGMVKVTPAHDPNDYDMGTRHELEGIDIMEENGTMSFAAGPYKGMDRFECRKKILKDLEQNNLLLKIEDHAMAIRKCYRCHTIVEPRVSKQWFVKMKPLGDKALDEFNQGRPQFYPTRFGNIYKRWLEGIRDWCISRQIWWGHQIPVWYCGDCSEMTVSVEAPTACSHCGKANLEQDPDVLDTWFSSWLWPLSTLGWPDKTPDLKSYYPTQVLATAQEIIFFWVARMVMAGLEFEGRTPFEDVYIHGTVRDQNGLKMSKSLGNVIDPLKIIDQFGGDALRFSLMVVASRGNDIYISDKNFEVGRNFATKIWNAVRFLLQNKSERPLKIGELAQFEEKLSHDDKLILSKMNEMVETVEKTIGEFRFNDTALCLYDFFRTHFCDRYIESVKPYFENENEDSDRVRYVLYTVLSRFLICLHPVMPFLTEELWQILRELDSSLTESVAVSSYPEKIKFKADSNVLLFTEQKYNLITAGRNLKKQFNLSPKLEMKFVVKVNGEKKSFLTIETPHIRRMLKAKVFEIDSEFVPTGPWPSEVTELGTLFMELDKENVDLDAEKHRVEKKIKEKEKGLSQANQRLENEKFLSNAKPDAIQKEKEKRAALETDMKKLKETLSFFLN